MKKLISLVLAALLVFSGVAFAAEDLSGTWYVTGMTMEGQTIDPSMLGIEMIFALNADGTAALSAMGEESTGTWTADGDTVTLSIDGDSMVLAFDGAALTGEMDGVGVILEREASSYEAPSGIPAESITDFDGTWVPTSFGVAGMILDKETIVSFAGDDADIFDALVFNISNGNVDAAGDILTFELTDGALLATADGMEGTFRIQLMEGDMIQIDMPSIPFSMYCERIEVAQQAA